MVKSILKKSNIILKTRAKKLIWEITLNFPIFMILVLIYFSISIRVNPKFYTVFSLVFYAFIAVFIVYKGIKLKRNKYKSLSYRLVEGALIIFVSAAILCSKAYIDHKNLLIIKASNQSISVHELVENSIKEDNNIKKYDSLFKISKYENNKIYYTDEFEPALKIVYAYLDKAKVDNVELFGYLPTGELTIKFDYDENVFKQRNKIINDYAGLYSSKDKTAYVFIKDCYKDALALNLKSSYLRQTLLHEYTHHILYEFLNSNQISENKIPAWFKEGVSEYVGLQENGGNIPKKMVSFNELNTQQQWANYKNKGYDVYEQSHYAVRQLTLIKGEKVIKDILLKVKDKDFNTAFNEVTGMSLKDYEKSLNDDSKNGWKKYNKMNPQYISLSYTDIKIECLEKYIVLKPDNIDALLDLAHLYEISNYIDKERITLNKAVEKDPENILAWHREARLYKKINNFDSAIKAFEKGISIDKNSGVGYSYLAEAWLTKDVNKAAAAIQKAKELDNSNFISKQAKAILTYQSFIKNNKPYEGCLQLIKSETINDDNIKKAMIEKLLHEYPNIKNQARSELETIKSRLK